MVGFLPAFLALPASIIATVVTSASGSSHSFIIPPSQSIAQVKMIHAATALGGHIPFIKPDPDLPTIPTTHLDIWTFLIEHPKLKRRVLFDLGLRKDTNNLSPAAQEAISPDGPFPFTVDKDVPDQLVDAGVPLDSIDALIWRSVGTLT
jgi:hypothetical protein